MAIEQAPARGKFVCRSPSSKQQYDDIWDVSARVRIWIDQMVERSPKLFPQQIASGGSKPFTHRIHTRVFQFRVHAAAYLFWCSGDQEAFSFVRSVAELSEVTTI